MEFNYLEKVRLLPERPVWWLQGSNNGQCEQKWVFESPSAWGRKVPPFSVPSSRAQEDVQGSSLTGTGLVLLPHS